MASIWRFAEFFSENAFDDGTWASVNLVVWCCVEPGVYLIAACLLALRPLLNFILHDKPLSTLLLRFRTRRTKDYSNFSNEDSQRHGIELTSDTKKQGFGVPQRLDEDRQALNWEYNGTGNNMQSTAERVESVSPLPVMMDRVHVRQEFSLDLEGGSIKT